jgi:hypothetical protein
MARGMAPGHHLPLELKSPRIPLPVDQKQREIKPLVGCQTHFNEKATNRSDCHNSFFSLHMLPSSPQ